MSYKNVEAAREVRLWLAQIVLPICVASCVLMSNAKLEQALKELTIILRKNFLLKGPIKALLFLLFAKK
ncbi:MAG: hypothetical protein ACI35S_00510 [Anaeroplasma sp.]